MADVLDSQPQVANDSSLRLILAPSDVVLPLNNEIPPIGLDDLSMEVAISRRDPRSPAVAPG